VHIPQLRTDRIKDRVPELVTHNVWTFPRVEHLPADVFVKEPQTFAVVVGVEFFTLVEMCR